MFRVGLLLSFACFAITANAQCTTIQAIQGEGEESSLLDERVLVCGAYVTAVVNNGFFMQEEPLMGSSASSGIFVFTFDEPTFLSAGAQVDVNGTVGEFQGLTQLTDFANVTLMGGDPRFFEPIDIELPVADFMDLERYEGMLVNMIAKKDNSLVISEFFNFDRFGEVVICSAPDEQGRLFQYTSKSPPNIDLYAEHLDMVRRSCLEIDDNDGSSNREDPKFGSVYPIDSFNFFRGGMVVTLLKGPLWIRNNFGPFWRVAPLSTDDLAYDASTNPREDAPRPKDFDTTVVVSNLLNYWTTIGFDSSLRGADTEEEFDRQVRKTIPALVDMDGDILGLVELENVAGNTAAKDIAARLTDASPYRTFVAASDVAGLDLIGPDVIKVDVVYDTKKFEMVGYALLTDDQVDPALLAMSTTGSIFDGQSRVPFAVTLEDKKHNLITLCVNHFKSKGNFDGTASGPDDDLNDGAAHYNLMRTLSSKALVAWMDTNPTGVYTENVLLVGDFNAYGAEEPITHLIENGYTSLIDPDTCPYTYVFDGQWGTLDYAFVKDTVACQASAEVWHVNSDEADLLNYNLDFGRNPAIYTDQIPERFSDHDPIIVGMNLKGKKCKGAKKANKAKKMKKADKEKRKGKKNKMLSPKGGY